MNILSLTGAKKKCPECDFFDCDDELCGDENMIDRLIYNASIDLLESLILAHARNGIDVEDAKYMAAVKEVVKRLNEP